MGPIPGAARQPPRAGSVLRAWVLQGQGQAPGAQEATLHHCSSGPCRRGPGLAPGVPSGPQSLWPQRQGHPRPRTRGRWALQEKPAERPSPCLRRSVLPERLCLKRGAQAGGHGSSGSRERAERASGGSGLRQDCPSLPWPLLIAVVAVRLECDTRGLGHVGCSDNLRVLGGCWAFPSSGGALRSAGQGQSHHRGTPALTLWPYFRGSSRLRASTKPSLTATRQLHNRL